MADWRFVDKERFCILLLLLRTYYYVVGEKMIRFRKGKLKTLFSGKNWAVGIDTREIYLFKVWHDEAMGWLAIHSLCFWLEIYS